jgi:hypothetical protein
MRAVAVVAALAVLGGCASSSADSGRGAALTVRVTVSGGPLMPSGEMAVSDAPQVGVRVVATTKATPTRYSARTDADGLATLRLPARPTPYTVTASSCGASQTVLMTGRSRAVSLQCQVP